ncbi:YafY family protein [Leucobacter ruminantium]|uniref:WYL domain-containing protein n=1 Tax=Leucobacter ruminantium TaxID=1289170 RepID=A0A939LY56_9MICO|nr:WYL domain-containing protein [Leucobacter ruminantium]MBO1806266.1 WYL domain-containing protein [Leucobacter ruminantium]
MAEAGARSRVPSEQRIFSLVLALVASPEGATKRELLSSVYGYADRFRHGEASAALDRQFERDKEQLRSLGIRVDTIDSPLEPGNNQLTRYRISKDRLQFPGDLRFSSRELMLLRLAALAWSEGSLTAESRRAAMKLESLGAGLDVRHLGVAPMLGIPEPAAAALQSAIDDGRTVRFDYALPGRDEPLGRRVAPLRLHRADGRWHLIAWDLERDASRVFLLSRIRSSVSVQAEPFDPSLRDRVDGIVAELLAQRERHRAVVEVRLGSVAESRLAARAEPGAASADGPAAADGARLLAVRTLDPHALAEELAGYGAEAVVREPLALRELVIERLHGIAEEHGGRRA